jgi:protein-S-isoprenylcysteine O-methyltransferase Ste14
MTTEAQPSAPRLGRFAAKGTVLLSFVVALEIVIMISPFALYFYAVFNPVLLALGSRPATRWLTAFFLPHMIVPPDGVLATVRVLGSLLFAGGLLVFLVCALQVYAGKIGKTGVASRGLYAVIRHPQYVALAVAGVGLAILWPRFLTLVLLAVMVLLYYLLAKDEERRMLARHPQSYATYMARTGMFVPRLAPAPPRERQGAPHPVGAARAVALLGALLLAFVGTGFALRAYTIAHLPLEAIDGVDTIAVTADDLVTARTLLPSVLGEPAIASRIAAREPAGHRWLSYVIPVDYTMQGMIADTGEEWRLFEQHRTLPMITDYVLHPFGHLTEGHAVHAGMHAHDSAAMRRRFIFLDVSSERGALASPRDDFGIAVTRRPRFFVDVHLHTGEILSVHDIPARSGWGSVPTPTF